MRATIASTPSTSASTRGDAIGRARARWRRAMDARAMATRARDEDAGARARTRTRGIARATTAGDAGNARRGERARAAAWGERGRDEGGDDARDGTATRGRRGERGGRRGRGVERGFDAWEHLTATGRTMDPMEEAHEIEDDGWASPFDEENDAFVGTPERAAALDEEIRSVKPQGFQSVGSQSRDSGKVTYGLRPLYGKLLTKKIKELGDARRLDAVFDLLEMSAIPTTPKGRKITMGAVIGACVKCNELDTAYKLLSKLDGVSECGAGAPAYSALMLGYARQGRLTEALGLLEQWEKGRGPKDGKFGVGKRGNIILRGSWKWSKDDVPKYGKRDDMGTQWHPKRTATTRMLFAALDACATNGDVRQTRKFMKRITTWEGRVRGGDNFNEDEYIWNALVKACARSQDALGCLNILPEMSKAGVEPTRVTYNITISACAKAGRPDWCRALLRRMDRIKDANVHPNEISYTTTLVAETAAARDIVGGEFAGGVDVVKDLWSRFIAKGVKQDGIVVGAFVNAFVAYGDIDTALTALDFGYEKKMYISPSVYFSAMRLLATNGDEQGVRKLSSKLQRKNKSGEIKAECDMFEAEACAAAGNVEGARAAIFRVQNGNEEAAARVFRDRSSGVLVALFVQEVLECDANFDNAAQSFDEEDDDGAQEFDPLDDDVVLNHNGSLCRWEKPDVWSVTQALDLLDGAWSYDEFDEQGIGASPAPPPRGGWANAVQVGAVEPLLFKKGVAPGEPIASVLPNVGECMRRGDIVRRSDSVADALESLGANVNAVVIDDETGIPVGTFRRADGCVGTDITVGQVMSAAPERLSLDETTVGDVAMMCVRDSAALIAVVDEQGCIVGALRQDDVLTNARVNGDDASPR